ncbi:uncharacterized protein [Nicotiana tomentosiformis]|uniref:uncharacterized protein n=1 Tax=Nicotiana tomentosiformis TaxID=4098 RepID=UPI00388C59F3
MPKKVNIAQKGKSVDDETTGRVPRVTRSRGESHSETPSQTSHTLPSPEETPAPHPDAPGQEMRDVIQLLTRLVAAQARRQEVGIGHADRAISARCLVGLGVYYTCGYPGHIMRDCPTRGGAGIVQPAGSIAGSTLSYVTPLGFSKFRIEPELIKTFEVSTPVGEPVIAKWIYRDCIVVLSRSTVADLIELDIVEFDVIMESSTLQSIPVVNEFPNVFPDELPGLPPEWEIEFAIDTLPDTQPIFITPYRMEPAELRELKEQLRDLLEKGFIRPIKENVVADALNRRYMGSFSYLQPEKSEITYEIHKLANLGVRLLDSGRTRVTIQDTTTSSLVTEVKERQYEDPVLAHYRDTTPQKEKTPLEITRDRVLRYRGLLCVPNVVGLRQQVMGEAHYSRYSIHLGATEMYHDIKGIYWWDGMNKDIV